MKFSLLEMVQMILSSMDSDEVNSIGDTIEAQSVANVIKTTYNDLFTLQDLPEKHNLFSPNPSIDPSLPTVMYLPDNVDTCEWVEYNKVTTEQPDQKYDSVKYLDRKDFLFLVSSFVESNTNVFKYNLKIEGVPFYLLGKNDKNPDYWTSFDDRTLVFDSYYKPFDTTLQASKTRAWGRYSSEFIMSDDFTPDLSGQQFSYLFNEAKATCFAELKQIRHEKAEKTARRNLIHSQWDKFNVPSKRPAIESLPDYGRRRR